MKIVFFTAFLLLLTHAQTPESKAQNIRTQSSTIQGGERIPLDSNTQGSESQIDETYLEEVEDAAIHQQLDGKLNDWVIKELKEASNIKDFSFGETFVIYLQPEQSFQYKWNLANPQSKKRDYLLFLGVYTYQEGKEVSANKDPQKENYVQVQAKSKFQESYSDLGKLYIYKTFSVTFLMESKFIRVTNRNPIPVLVEINMETDLKELGSIRGIATNKHFELPAEKLSTIYEQLKNTEKSRARMYKWEWGFLEREERYDDQMLKLTGVELLVILGTAIVQMYCIRNLLENKQVI